MTKLPKLLLLALLLTLTACATSSNGDGDGDSDLMGLDDGPSQAVWADWTPAEARSPVPGRFVDEVVAFDYWQIGSEEAVEETWSGISALLDYLRRDELSEAQRNTASALLQALDSDEAMMDVTFVVSLDPERQAEGLVVRLFRQLGDDGPVPAVAVYLEREEGTPEGFDRALMWAVAGFEEAHPFTIALEDEAAGWAARRFDGTAYPLPDGAPGELAEASELASGIFERAFWQPFTGPDYVEALPRAEQQGALVGPIEPALGLEVRERQLEEVYRDTVFPPRMDSTPFSGRTDF